MLTIVLIVVAAALLVALAAAGLLIVSLRAMGRAVPLAAPGGGPGALETAGFLETLRRVPLGLVVALDLLDLALDIFSAPIIWMILDRRGLRPLRAVATVEALIPFTNVLPTMTICWVVARFLRPGPAPVARTAGGGDPAAGRAPSPRRSVENTAPARG